MQHESKSIVTDGEKKWNKSTQRERERKKKKENNKELFIHQPRLLLASQLSRPVVWPSPRHQRRSHSVSDRLIGRVRLIRCVSVAGDRLDCIRKPRARLSTCGLSLLFRSSRSGLPLDHVERTARTHWTFQNPHRTEWIECHQQFFQQLRRRWRHRSLQLPQLVFVLVLLSSRLRFISFVSHFQEHLDRIQRNVNPILCFNSIDPNESILDEWFGS